MQLTSLADLLDVQDIDLQIDRLLEKRQGLPELESYRSAHDELTRLEEQRAAAAGELKELELEFDRSEGELEILEAKLTEHETRLFAGGMSGRETEHMRLEVQSLKGQQSTMEERVLVLLERVDPARATVGEIENRVAEVSAEKSRLEGIIKEEWRLIDAELARKEERKTEALIPIPADMVEMYEKLREIKEGVAIGRFENGICGGCHMALSSAEQAEAFAAEIPRCVHCRRLLVA
jgi:predicted  nucleic acid-binding Zn-ribbon protein